MRKNCSGLKQFKYRENGFNEAEEEAIHICKQIYITPEFKSIKEEVYRNKCLVMKALLYYAQQMKKNVLSTLIFPILDQGIVSINQRFTHLDHFNNYFGFLFDIGKNTTDIIGVELYDELCLLSEITDKGTSPLRVLQKILCNSVGDVYPNVAIAIKIVLTLSVTTVTAERSFSKLKLVKNYLRTLSQEKTKNLAIIYSKEREIVDELDLDDVICTFADLKSRKVNF
ncbi:PREDICTED: uncharacterized protein LOC107161765 [Diuraphis noxia]|uniref:uncharacterized protein LOC107161765 n=1 Tax=Diuraphis noxia TaxID=143948 RepID=UPI0007637CD5|nr:PREDICTED: uncharacterized protein LOC107161765 [Diuraphis noxia]